MKRKTKITPTTIFTYIGGVLLTNGWDRMARTKAIEHFDLDPAETEERHHLTFDTYESGKISLHEYLTRLVFYKKRKFTEEDSENSCSASPGHFRICSHSFGLSKKITELKLP